MLISTFTPNPDALPHSVSLAHLARLLRDVYRSETGRGRRDGI